MFKRIAFAAGLLAAATSYALAAGGQLPSGWIVGNNGASAAQGSPSSVSAILDRALGSTRGSLIERGVTTWGLINPGTSGKPFISGGTGADPSYATLGIVGGGTNCAAASGTCLDNITGFGSTGLLDRTGSGAYSFLAAPVGTIVGTSDTQTLTSKILTSPTINGGALSGTFSGAPTFSGIPLFSGLSTSGTCANSLLIQSGGAMMLGNCPGTATSIAVATTTVTGTCSTLQLIFNNAGTTGCENIASILTAGAGISITGSTNATIAQSLSNVSLTASPANPTGTASTTIVMMGFGVSTCRWTPAYSGRAHLSISGLVQNSTNSDASGVAMLTSNGAGPANGVAQTGTQIGSTMSPIGGFSNGASIPLPFTLTGTVTGATVGTAQWLDLGLKAVTGGTAIVTSVTCNIEEY